MKKTVRKLNLHRETLRWLTGGVVPATPGEGIDPGNGVSVPSCIDGCPSAMCPTTLTP
jgi:hypothetical protein